MRSLLTFAALLLLALSLPISNLFIQRKYLASNTDPEFKAVSDTLVSKCADCHSKDCGQYPLYLEFPIGEYIIHRNIKNGQSAFLLSKEKLSGQEKFSPGDIERLSQAMTKGNMPPLQYVLLHWRSALNQKEQKLLVTWIQKRLKENDIRPIPSQNFFKPDLTKAKLGEKLFNDRRLSSDNSVSCASCHSLEKGGADQLRYSKGPEGQIGTINTPSVLNAAYNFTQYWDARSLTLKSQVASAISNPQEMNSNWNQVIKKLETDRNYVEEFKSSYKEGISANSISDAIAEYEHTLLTPGSRFDKFLEGDQSALSKIEKAGFASFKKHECFVCHSGPALGGLSIETMGLNKDYFKTTTRSAYADQGRFNVTHNMADLHRFKVPSLRNVELTAPYLHDGSATSLEDAIKVMSVYQSSKALSDLECKQVLAFLRSLTGTLNGKSLELTPTLHLQERHKK